MPIARKEQGGKNINEYDCLRLLGHGCIIVPLVYRPSLSFKKMQQHNIFPPEGGNTGPPNSHRETEESCLLQVSVHGGMLQSGLV